MAWGQIPKITRIAARGTRTAGLRGVAKEGGIVSLAMEWKR